jgi:hypothetical protein
LIKLSVAPTPDERPISSSYDPPHCVGTPIYHGVGREACILAPYAELLADSAIDLCVADLIELTYLRLADSQDALGRVNPL